MHTIHIDFHPPSQVDLKANQKFSRVHRHSNSFHSPSSEPRSESSLVEPKASYLRGDVKSMQPFVKLVRLPLEAIESFLQSLSKRRFDHVIYFVHYLPIHSVVHPEPTCGVIIIIIISLTSICEIVF